MSGGIGNPPLTMGNPTRILLPEREIIMSMKENATAPAENAAITPEEVAAFDLSKPDTTPAADEPAEIALRQKVDVDGAAMIADLSTAITAYCSIHVDTVEDKIKVYNAMSNAQESLAEHIGEEIPIRHIYVDVIQCENEKTGEKENCPRIVLIGQDGRTFQAVSKGVFGSLKRIFQMFGTPDTWDFALVVKLRRVKTRRGYYTNTLEAVGVIPENEA